MSYLLLKPTPKPASWETLVEGCLQARTGNVDQCQCLADGLNQRLNEKQMQRLLAGDHEDPGFVAYLERQVKEITAQCI